MDYDLVTYIGDIGHDLSGRINQEYVFFNGKRVARVEYTYDEQGNIASATPHYYFSDHPGSADVVTNADGSLIEEESVYYPFGGELPVTLGPNHFKFTGKERDPETGLDYFIARHYTSSLGRFLQPDEFTGGPVDAFSSNDPAPPGPTFYADKTNPQSLNKYAYTYNNPLRYTDPDGHCAVACFGAIGAVAGAVIFGGGSLYFDWKDGRPLDFSQAGKEALTGAAVGAVVGATLGELRPDVDNEASSPHSTGDHSGGNPSGNESSDGSGDRKSAGEPPQLKAGKEAHQNEPVRPGEKAEVRTPSGRRMDRYDANKAHIREIKPDNARGEKAGQKQLRDYKSEMDKVTGKSHTTELTKYKKD